MILYCYIMISKQQSALGALGMLYNEREISSRIDLCNNRGKLLNDSIGWSRSPVFRCNLSRHFLRKKKWNYWSITNDNCFFSITISNIDYIGMVFAYFLDLKTMKFIERTIMKPFGMGCSLPEEVNETVVFSDRRMETAFLKEADCVHITVNCNDFGGLPMKADLAIQYPEGYETLNVVIPWSENKFQYTSKHQGLAAEGSLEIGGSKYEFPAGSSFGCLDFGRGVWPYKTMWNWANASGMGNGKSIGLNLGAVWTDGTGMTENGFIINGKLTKLSENVLFEYDKKDLMKPWVIKTEQTGRVNLVFTPVYQRVAKTNFVVLKSIVNQMIGYFSGTITTDDDEIIDIERFIGGAEEHFGKW